MLPDRTLSAWTEYIQGLHSHDMDFDLARSQRVFDALDLADSLPHVITVAGTNGKGSCIELMRRILIANGYRTGTYTSPHLVRFNERIRVGDIEADDDSIIRALERAEQARDGEPLTFFEFTTLAALLIFIDQACDIVLLEAGLGGRLDVTNLVDADALVLTNVALDHQAWLGETREEIGAEKAGLMRPGQVVIYGDAQPVESVLTHAQSIGAQLNVYMRDFGGEDSEAGFDYWQSEDLPERHEACLQGVSIPFGDSDAYKTNACCVIRSLLTQPELNISSESIAEVFANSRLPGQHLPGRQQIVSESPLIVADVAHNPAACRVLSDFSANMIQQRNIKGRVFALFAMLSDKDIAGSLRYFEPLIDSWAIAELDDDRAADKQQLENALREAVGPKHQEALLGSGPPRTMWDNIFNQLSGDDMFIVFGSFVLVGDILAYHTKNTGIEC